jgi:hypothetical protein
MGARGKECGRETELYYAWFRPQSWTHFIFVLTPSFSLSINFNYERETPVELRLYFHCHVMKTCTVGPFVSGFDAVNCIIRDNVRMYLCCCSYVT